MRQLVGLRCASAASGLAKSRPGWLGCSSWGGRCATSCGAQLQGSRRTRGATLCSDRRREVSPRGSLRSRPANLRSSAPQSPRPSQPGRAFGRGEGCLRRVGERQFSPGPTRNHAGMIVAGALVAASALPDFLWPSIFSSRSAYEAQAVSENTLGVTDTMFLIESTNAKNWRWISGLVATRAEAELQLAATSESQRHFHKIVEISLPRSPIFMIEAQGSSSAISNSFASVFAFVEPAGDEDVVHFNVYAFKSHFLPEVPGRRNGSNTSLAHHGCHAEIAAGRSTRFRNVGHCE